MPSVSSATTRFTAAEFQRMCDAGIFGDRRVELINGRVYRVAAQNHPHMMAISKTNRALVKVVPEAEWLTLQGTIHIDGNTTVDPKFIWLAVPIGTPERDWGKPVLLVEVSDSTYRLDSGLKLRKYAKVGIPDYWIVNVKAQRVEVCREPRNPDRRLVSCRYDAVTHHVRGETLSPLARPDVRLAVADLLA